MPEKILIVRWPDQQQQNIYSPSSIVESYFQVGEKITTDRFVQRCTEALEHASQRVELKYGFACTAAADSIHQVKTKFDNIEDVGGQVEVIEIQ